MRRGIAMRTNPSDARPVTLIVEDESLVRMFNADIPNEAVALLEARPDTRAMVTDVRMPGTMDGFGLGRH